MKVALEGRVRFTPHIEGGGKKESIFPDPEKLKTGDTNVR